MSFSGLIKNTCKKLGENNKPTYVVMSIAAVKGVCRPMFTMMDKKENPETKKYTALREGLTEVIAIPAYWACGEAAGSLAKKFYKDNAIAKRAQTNLMFLGVCTAALFIIPALCSSVIKPVMNAAGLKAPKPEKKDNLAELTFQNSIHKPQVHNNPYRSFGMYSVRPQTGMRVGL